MANLLCMPNQRGLLYQGLDQVVDESRLFETLVPSTGNEGPSPCAHEPAADSEQQLQARMGADKRLRVWDARLEAQRLAQEARVVEACGRCRRGTLIKKINWYCLEKEKAPLP